MNSRRKRLLSLLLAAVMLLSLCPVTAMAEGGEEEVTEPEEVAEEPAEAEERIEEFPPEAAIPEPEEETVEKLPSDKEKTVPEELPEEESVTVEENAPMFLATANATASDACGDNLTWTLDENGLLTISGEGDMWNYSYESPSPWNNLCLDIMTIQIGDNVTSIGDNAFRMCEKLTNITIPDSVLRIGEGAFYYCFGLTQITIPSSVTRLDDSVFMGCRTLSDIVLPESLETIGNNAFYWCSNLKTIRIPNNVVTIGGCAFLGTGLISIIIPGKISTIKDGTFWKCGSLSNVVFPESLTTVESNAFYECYALSDIFYHGTEEQWAEITLEEFGNETLLSSKFHYVFDWTDDMPIAFGTCGDTLTWSWDRDGVLSITGKGDMWDYRLSSSPWYSSSIKVLSIGIDVMRIGDYAFHGCESLTSATIPISVTSIGDHAFSACCELTSVTIPNSVTNIGNSAFYGCSNLTNITIPNSVTAIGDYAFDCCNNLTNVYYFGNEKDWTEISMGMSNECLTSANIHYLGKDAVEYNGHFYKIFPNGTVNTWEEANTLCKSMDGYLAVISSEEENSFLYGLMRANGIRSAFFGYSDAEEEGVWKWSDNEVSTYINWHEGEPNSESNNEDYAMFYRKYSDGTWNDGTFGKGSASNGNAFFCEWDPSQNNDVHSLILFNAAYNEEQYYASEAFYSEINGFDNGIVILLEFLHTTESGCSDNSDYADIPELKPITMTAKVSGSDLSFDAEHEQNTLTETYKPFPFGQVSYTLLKLYPANPKTFVPGSDYEVTVTIDSDSISGQETVVCNFHVYDARGINEHLAFIHNDQSYHVSKKNTYGQNMVELKHDAEYQWSKWTSFDFDNYYDIVMLDLLSQMLGVDAVSLPSFELFSLLQKWNSNYKEVYSVVETLLNEVQGEIPDVSFTKTTIGKLMSESKYRHSVSDYNLWDSKVTYSYTPVEASDKNDLYSIANKVLENKVKPETIDKVFTFAEKGKIVLKYLNYGKDCVETILDIVNMRMVVNACYEADEEFKEVLRTFASTIPQSEKKLHETVTRYASATNDVESLADDILHVIFDQHGGKITFKTFKTITGASIPSWLFGCFMKLWGTQTVKIAGETVAISSTVAYAAVAGAWTGGTLGLLVSDLIADSGGKAEEMSKVISMSEFAPYIIQTLQIFEDRFVKNPTEENMALFENAFALHKGCQCYIVDHTAKAIETKGNSFIGKIGRLFHLDGYQDYDQLVIDTLNWQKYFEAMQCFKVSGNDSLTTKRKVIAVKCPVDVLITDPLGRVIASIVNNETVTQAEGVYILVNTDRAKYISVPADTDYSISITATDYGTMSYAVYEYPTDLTPSRFVHKEDIPLVPEQLFIGNLSESFDGGSEAYSLSSDEEVIPVYSSDLMHPQVLKIGDTLYFVYTEKKYSVGDSFLPNGNSKAQTVEAAYDIAASYHVNYDYFRTPWYDDLKTVTKVIIEPSFSLHPCESTSRWFFTDYGEINSLTSVDLHYLNVSKVADMSYMFYNCGKLPSLDVSGFDTSNVTDMNYMFSRCYNLRSIYVSPDKWSTKNVAYSTDYMFTDCTSLVGGMGTAYDENHTDATYAHIDGGAADPGYLTAKPETEAIQDFTVSVPSAMSSSVTITAPEGGWVVGENTFTVECEKACVLLVTNDDGKTYTRLTATASGDGYAFTADLTADSSIVCARKGDISGDGTISALEARQILMAGNGLFTLTPLQKMIADTNGDGTISALEARQILMAGNGLFTIGW